MKVAVGSKNKVKVNAVQQVLAEAEIVSLSVPSHVSAQPFSDEETLQGASNRAKLALTEGKADIGIGLEGGVMHTDHGLFMCNWGALATKEGKLFTAGGARMKLPDEFIQPLEEGKELSEVMEDYTKQRDIRSNEGAIGIFTNNYVDRTDLFVHVVKLLVGQYMYDRSKA
ncbi:inosine/xanthosine triphosphatase [Bacillus pseudomycoides]|nr:inosine/xanthosine triphosphatase [Bacillus pseudomycoides]